MKTNSQNYNANFVKRNAKKIKKEQNIPYYEALNLSSQNIGYNNYKHFLNKTEKESKKTPLKENKNPYRNLFVCAINQLIERNHISLNLDNVDENNENGHIFIKIFGHNSVVIWENIGFGELRISVWLKYNHNKHPQAYLEGNQKEKFKLTEPLANRKHYPKFVGVVASCWLERRTGKYIQGVKREGIFDIYTRKSELKFLKEQLELKPKGYEISGRFHI